MERTEEVSETWLLTLNLTQNKNIFEATEHKFGNNTESVKYSNTKKHKNK